jgi:palmitoyltransferase ZDHHC13/17
MVCGFESCGDISQHLSAFFFSFAVFFLHISTTSHTNSWFFLVGLNNHRQFILFITTLVVGIILFDYLVYQFFSAIPLPSSSSSSKPFPVPSSCPLPADVCYLTSHDPFLVAVASWATLQLIWTILLVASQWWQIAKSMTTVEVSNMGRWGSMGGRGESLRGQLGATGHQNHGPLATPGSSTADLGMGGQGSGNGNGNGNGDGHRHQHKKGRCDFMMRLLGLDLFTRHRAVDGLKNSNKGNNPFDTGSIVGNCRDFWTRGRELGVEYDKVYDVPFEGFKEAKLRRMMDEREGGLRTSGHGPHMGPGGGDDDSLDDLEGQPSGLSTVMGMGMGTSRSKSGLFSALTGGGRTAGYERVPASQV